MGQITAIVNIHLNENVIMSKKLITLYDKYALTGIF